MLIYFFLWNTDDVLVLISLGEKRILNFSELKKNLPSLIPFDVGRPFTSSHAKIITHSNSFNIICAITFQLKQSIPLRIKSLHVLYYSGTLSGVQQFQHLTLHLRGLNKISTTARRSIFIDSFIHTLPLTLPLNSNYSVVSCGLNVENGSIIKTV